MKRRTFIVVLVTAATASGLGIVIRSGNKSQKVTLWLSELFPQPDDAAALGEFYLGKYPDERNVEKLVNSVCPAQLGFWENLSSSAVHNSIRNRIQNEWISQKYDLYPTDVP